jgi:hypothetical protein
MLTTLKTLARAFAGATHAKLPVVCIVGHTPMSLATPSGEDYEETRGVRAGLIRAARGSSDNRSTRG